MKFRLMDFNSVRYGRGADAAKVEITNNENETDWLWMSTQDIKKNIMLHGPHLGLLEAANRYSMNVPALIISWRAGGAAGLLRPIEPVRERDGYWLHPDWPYLEEGEEAKGDAWLKLIGFETATEWMLNDDSDEASDVIARWISGDTDILAWQPKPPAENEGWFIASIHDHEDGPVCIWVRDKPAVTA